MLVCLHEFGISFALNLGIALGNIASQFGEQANHFASSLDARAVIGGQMRFALFSV